MSDEPERDVVADLIGSWNLMVAELRKRYLQTQAKEKGKGACSMNESEDLAALTLDDIDRMFEAARSSSIRPINIEGRAYYALTISRESRAMLIMLEAKARWKAQYRTKRIAAKKAKGFVYLDATVDYEGWSSK